MTIGVKDGSTWRDIGNTGSQGASVQTGSGWTTANTVWVNDGTAWRTVWRKSPFDTSVTNKKRDLVIVGDSITWGYGLVQTQAYPYLIQQRINSTAGYTTSGWCARAIHSDDYSTTPLNGGYAAPAKLIYATNIGQENAGVFSGWGGNKGGTPSWTEPGVKMTSGVGNSSTLGFNVSARPAYIVVRARGSGTLKFYQRDSSESFIQIHTETLSSSTGQIAAPTSSDFGTVSPLFYMMVENGDYATIEVLHPTNIYNGYSNGFINIIVVARNSYAIADYTSKTDDIKNCVINRVADGSATPIYLLALGTVSLYDTARQVSPSTYASQLSTIISALTTSPTNGEVILTLPPKPGGSQTLLSPYTISDYHTAIINLATSSGCHFVDLYNGPFQQGSYMGSGTVSSALSYQSGGLHPDATGSEQLANRYICALGL